MQVYLKEADSGHLTLVNSDGEQIIGQTKILITESVDAYTEVTATFTLDPKTQMYKGGDE